VASLCSLCFSLPAHADSFGPAPIDTPATALVLPEPAVLFLLGLGLSALAIKFRARRRT
jgi:hypothetical protein